MKYNNPHWKVQGSDVEQGDKSSVGEQIQLDVFMKQSLEEAAQMNIFTQLSSTEGVPAHMGKSIKKFSYVPLLDDDNTSDQGLNTSGTAVAGNLFGSSKDVGTVTAKLPILREEGGRINRVGFTRKVLESRLQKFGFFYDFTSEALNFDNDASLLRHMGREAITGAAAVYEQVLGNELIGGAAGHVFAGSAASVVTTSAETAGSESMVTAKMLKRMYTMLQDAHAPKTIKAVKGSRIVDSKIVGNGYVLYIGSALEWTFRDMEQFTPVEKYAASNAQKLTGEIGSVCGFRIIMNINMPELLGEGAAATTDAQKAKFRSSQNANALTTGNRGKECWDVFPMLAMSADTFTTLGFMTGGKGVKFDMITKMPGAESASVADPYGETGFSSIKWFHSTMIERPEWMVIGYSVAPL